MNSLVAEYRNRVPNDPRKDEEIVMLLGSAHDKDGRYAGYPDFVDEYQSIKAQMVKDSVPFSSEPRRGWARGMAGLKQSAVGVGALAADLVGAEGWRDSALEKYKEIGDEVAADSGPGVARVEDIGSVSDAVRFGMGKVGELLPQIGEAVVSGVAGAAIGSAVAPGPGTAAGAVEGFLSRTAAKKLLAGEIESILTKRGLSTLEKAAVTKELKDVAEKKALEKPLSEMAANLISSQTKSMLSKGGATGAELANFYGIGAGTIYGETANREGVDKADARTAALVGGIGSAIANAPLPLMVINRFFPGASQEAVRSYMQRLASDALREIPIGAGSEVMDELVQIAAEKYADPKLRDTPLTDEDLSRLLNAGVVGGFAGALTSPISAAPSQGFHPAIEQHFANVPDARRRQIAALVVRKESGSESEQDINSLRNLTLEEQNFATVFGDMTPEERNLYAAASQDLGGDDRERQEAERQRQEGLLVSREAASGQTTTAKAQTTTAGAATTAPASRTRAVKRIAEENPHADLDFVERLKAFLDSGKPLAYSTFGDGRVRVGYDITESAQADVKLTPEAKRELQAGEADLQFADTPDERAAAKSRIQRALRPAAGLLLADPATSAQPTPTSSSYAEAEKRSTALQQLGYTEEEISNLNQEDAKAIIDAGTESPRQRLRKASVATDVEDPAVAVQRAKSPNDDAETFYFKTAKGSTYVAHQGGGTRRNKAARAEHPGDSGAKEKSTKTIYVTPEVAQQVLDQKNLMFDDGDGTVGLTPNGTPMFVVYRSGPRKGDPTTIISTKPIPHETSPKVGLSPVEFWGPLGLTDSFHVGNAIVEIQTPEQRIAEAAAKTNVNPTETQKESGKYQKGKVNLDGFEIAIENPVGSERSGKDASGKPWTVPNMPAHYGYFTDATGSDGDKVDVYVGPNPTSPKVFVVDQLKSDGSFDETKTLYGFDSLEQAVATYDAAFSDGSGPRRRGAVTEITKDRLREWLDSKQTKKAFAYEATPTSQIAKIGALTGPQFAGMASESKGGAQVHAYKFGASLKNESELEALKMGLKVAEKSATEVKTIAETAINEGDQAALESAMVEYGQLTQKVQWFKEAIEAATGEGKPDLQKKVLGDDYVAPFGKKVEAKVEPKIEEKPSPEPVKESKPEPKPVVFKGTINGESRAITLDDVDFNRVYKSDAVQRGWFRPTGEEVATRELATKLTSEASPEGSKSKTATHRVTAVLDNETGKVHLLSTYTTHGKVMITKPDKAAKGRPGMQLSAMLDAVNEDGLGKYKVIGSARLTSPTEHFNQEFDSLDAFENEFGKPADEQIAASTKTVEVVDATVLDGGKREDVEKIDDEDSITIPEDRPKIQINEAQLAILKNMPAFDSLQEMADAIQSGDVDVNVIEALLDLEKQDPNFLARVIKNGIEEELKAYGYNIEESAADRGVRQEGKPAAVAKPQADIQPAQPDVTGGPSRPEAAVEGEQDSVGEQGQKGDAGNEESDSPGGVMYNLPQGESVESAKHRTLTSNILQAASKAGINVTVIQGDTGMGEYNPATRSITQVIGLTVGSQDASTAFHEVAHDVFANELPEVRDSILRAISRLTDRTLGIDAGTDPRIAESNPSNLAADVLQQERLVEATARQLVREGFNPVEAQGFAHRFVTALKDAYYAAVKVVLKALDMEWSEDMARDYFTHQVKALLSGERNGFSFAQWARVGTPDVSTRGQRWFTAQERNIDGSADYEYLPDDSVAASRFNFNAVLNNLPQPISEGTRKTKVEKLVAPLNHLIELHKTAAEAVGLTPDEMRAVVGVDSPEIARESFGNWFEVDGSAVQYDSGKTLDGFADKSNSDAVLKSAYINTQSLYSRASKVKADSEMRAEELGEKLKRQKERIAKDREEYKNLAGQTVLFRKEVLRSFKDIFNSIYRTSKRKGIIEQQLIQIDPKMDLKRYANAFESMVGGKDGPLNSGTLFNALDAMANDPTIDLSKPVVQIREDMVSQPTKYDIFLKDTNESRALLATAVAFAKAHTSTIAELELRREKSGEKRVEIEERLAKLREEKKDFASDLRELARTSKLEERARAAYRKKHRDLRATERSIEAANNKAKVAGKMMDPVGKEMAKLGAKLDLAKDFVLADGAVYYAVKPGLSSDAIQSSAKILVLDKFNQSVVNPEKLQAELVDMKGWLMEREAAYDGGDLSAKDSVYQSVKRQFLDMAGHLHFQMEAEPASRFMAELSLMGDAKAIRESYATPSAQMLDRRTNLYEVIKTKLLRDGSRVGHKVIQLENVILKLIPMPRETLRRRVIDVAKDVLEYRTADLAETYAGNREQFVRQAYLRVLKQFNKDRYLVELAGGKMEQVVSAVRDLIEVHDVGGAGRIEALEKGVAITDPITGNETTASVGVSDPKLKVYDPVTGTMVAGVRRFLKIGPWTFSRKIGRTFNPMANALNNSGWATFQKTIGRESDDELGVLGEAYKEDPEMARELVDKYFNQAQHGSTVWRSFLENLAKMPDSLFFAPKMADGVTSPPANPDLVLEAFNQTEAGDMVGFAENLFDLHGGVGDKASYVQSVAQTLADIYQQVSGLDRRMNPDPSGMGIKSLAGAMPDALINSREIDGLPSQWFEYHDFDQPDNARSAQQIAFEIAYGPGGSEAQALVQTIASEITQAITKLSEERLKVQESNPFLDKNKIDAIAKKNLGDKEFRRLELFEKYRGVLDHKVGAMSDYFRKNNSPDGTLRTATRLGSTLGAFVVQSASSAIYQMSQLYDSIFRYGFSPTTFKMTGKIFARAAHEIAASMMQAVGFEMGGDSEFQELRERIGSVDSAAVAKIRDSFTRWEGESAAAFGLRATGDIINAGINRVGKDAGHVVFRPGGIFTVSTMAADWAITDGMWKTVSRFVGKGIEHLKANPEKLGKMTARDLGLKEWNGDQHVFNQLSQDMQRWGIDFDAMVRGAMARGDGTMFTDDEALRLQSLAMAEISSQASLSTMTSAAWSNSIARFMMPLLGWSLRRTGDLFGKRLDLNGQNSMKATARAMVALSVIAVGGLALSAMVDRYYEDLLNKKRNLRPVTSFGGMVEHMARIGQTGFFGELVNSATNIGTGGDNRILSLDRRVVALSAFQTVINSITTAVNQGEIDYARTVRPILAGTVGGGMLQYLQLVNNVAGFDNVESRITGRMNAQNWLRAGGRELGMDVRSFGGAGAVSVTPMSPYITRMELAAYGNNPVDFQQAYREAVAQAQKMGNEDPVDAVKRGFSARNPLRLVFQTSVSESEYRRLLNSLPESGREDVSGALSHYNRFAEAIGARSYEGTKEKSAAIKTYKPADFRQALQFR